MDILKADFIALFAIFFAVLFMFLGRSNRKRTSAMLETGKANTQAVEENTAALKELIQRLEQLAAK